MQIAALVLAAGYSAEKEYTFKSNGQAYIDASALGLSMTAGKLVCAFLQSNVQSTRAALCLHRCVCVALPFCTMMLMPFVTRKQSQTVTGRSTNADVDTWNLAQAHFHW